MATLFYQRYGCCHRRHGRPVRSSASSCWQRPGNCTKAGPSSACESSTCSMPLVSWPPRRAWKSSGRPAASFSSATFRPYPSMRHGKPQACWAAYRLPMQVPSSSPRPETACSPRQDRYVQERAGLVRQTAQRLSDWQSADVRVHEARIGLEPSVLSQRPPTGPTSAGPGCLQGS
jgi:hypothetical protein